MTRIFIENYELDLTAEISHQLTFSIDDIRNLDSKTTSFSKTIIIPGSQRNNKIFGNIYELSNANFPNGQVNAFYDFDASRSAQARIEINGLQAMKGTMRLLSITVDKGAIEYEVALFGELGGFMSAVGIKKLEDIDYSKYNHNWNYDNIVATWQDQGEWNITTNYSIAGPFSTEKYDVVYRIRIHDANASPIQPFDKIRVTGTTSNDGIYTVAQVFWFPSAVRTDIYVFEPLAAESGNNINIKVQDPDGYGYVYPLIDYGVSDPSGALGLHPRNWDFKTFRPAIFALDYIDNIITGAGYTWESNFLKTDFFRSLIIPNNDIGLEKRGATDYLQVSGSTLAYDYNPSGSTIIKENVQFPSIVTNVNFTASASNSKFTYNAAGSVTAKVTVNFNGSLIKPKYSIIELRLVINDHAVQKFTLPDAFNRYSDVIQGSVEFVQSFELNDVVRFEIYYYRGSSRYIVTDHTLLDIDYINLSIVNDPPGFIKYTYNEELEMNNIIPKNIYQKDFFISIMKMFNLMVVERKDKNKHLVIEPYVDFYNTDRATYQDWSYKVNREKPIIIKPMSEINSRLYEFKLKDDSDFYNEDYKKRFNQTYGNRTFDNQLEFAKESSSVEVIFSPAVLVGYQDEDKVFPAIYKKEGELRVPMAHNIRIMQIKRIADVTEFELRNGSPTSVGTLLGTQGYYLYAGHLNSPDYPYIDINWGATKQLYFTLAAGSLQYNLFNNFYSPYMAEIIDKDSRLVTCEMKLTEADIFNLDFSKFIMIDGVLFRLVKIYDWSEGALTKVDLLRVINTTYIPDSPSTSKVFRMRFLDMDDVDTMLSGSASNVDDWNTFFGLSGGNIFNTVYVDNKDVILLGNVRFEITANLFQNDTNIIGMWDNIGAIELVNTAAFSNSTIQVFHSSNIDKIFDDAFADSSIYECIIPTANTIGNNCFKDAYDLISLDLSAIEIIGDTTANDSVFSGISGNNITLKIKKAAVDDDDVQQLLSNNTVNLTIT